MKRINSKLLSIGITALSACIISCSKSDNNQQQPASKENHYKITVTLNNINAQEDFVSISFAGGTLNGKSDVWKVNGATRTGESAIGLSKNDFVGTTKTYVIETIVPILPLSGSVQVINYGEILPMSLKIEKANEVKVNENLTLTGDGTDFSKLYTL